MNKANRQVVPEQLVGSWDVITVVVRDESV